MQNFAENCRLSKKQEKAILELLNPSSRTIGEVAKQVGVSERTLHYWLKLPRFQEKLEQERVTIRKEAFNKLSDTLSKAVERLGELLDSQTEQIKLRASQAILDYNIKLAEVKELEERLTKLEDLNK